MPHIPRSGPPRPSPAALAAAAPDNPDNPLPRFRGPVVELDVREELRNGREPFTRIMAAIDSLGPDGTLHLRATFQPAPLFRVLGSRGFEHHSVAHAPDDWSVWFYRPTVADATDGGATAGAATAGPADRPPLAAPELAETPPAPGHEITLDVRGLEPPEPMVRTLEALERLPAGAVLVQHNDRVPQFLLPILGERGFRHEVHTTASDGVRVRITRAD